MNMSDMQGKSGQHGEALRFKKQASKTFALRRQMTEIFDDSGPALA
jgi:hypothetical protein